MMPQTTRSNEFGEGDESSTRSASLSRPSFAINFIESLLDSGKTNRLPASVNLTRLILDSGHCLASSVSNAICAFLSIFPLEQVMVAHYSTSWAAD